MRLFGGRLIASAQAWIKLNRIICVLGGWVCWSLTSLCHSNGHIETMPAREINPFNALTRIRSEFFRTQWSTSNHQRVDMTTPQTAQPSGVSCFGRRRIRLFSWRKVGRAILRVLIDTGIWMLLFICSLSSSLFQYFRMLMIIIAVFVSDKAHSADITCSTCIKIC